MSKQDRQGVRTPAEIEQKYGLGQFMYNQNQKNQELLKGISNLGDSFSAYKEENEERLSSMSDSFNETINGVEEGLSKEIEALAKGIFNMIYPVGHIYFSASATNPSTLFGGTWERIEDTFLLAAGSSYAAGATGGEATHTLSVNEMPIHDHAPSNRDSAGSDTNYKRQFTTNLHTSSDSTGRAEIAKSTSSETFAMVATTASDITGADYTSKTGGSAAHNNMPPYLAVYVWKRTA